MGNTKFFGDIGVSTFGKIGAVYTFKNTVAANDNTVTTLTIDVKDKQGTIVSWGKNNAYPQEILAASKKNGSSSSALRFLRKAHYGNGQIFLREDSTNEGKRNLHVVPPNSLPENIRQFYSKSQMARFWKETIADLEWFSIAFPEYILSNDFKTINRVKRQRTAWCRFEVMNPENGLVEHVYISEKFGKGGSVSTDSEFVAKVPLIDSYWSAEEVREYCRRNKIYKFIRPIFYPLIDEAYYPEAEWHAIHKSGWMAVANSVPEYKNNLFKNQVSIKYLIEIDERFFEQKYAEAWKDYTPAKRIEIREGVINTINDHLSGNENAGKSIQSMMLMDNDGKQLPAIKITTIDDKFKDGSYLPEAEAANSEILFAHGVDPTLIGAGIPGGKLGAGSGSDKTAAFNILSALFKTNRETTLEVYDFIRDYNGWDTSLQASFENTVLTTLDKNPTGTQQMA